jgi:hypothetical protein
MTEEEKKAKKEKIKSDKEQLIQRRRLREERRIITQQRVQRIQEENKKTDYEVINMTGHELVLYWGFNNDDKIRKFAYSGQHSTSKIYCVKSKHRIVAIPFLEVCEQNGPNAVKVIQLPASKEVPYVTIFDMEMKNFDGTSIIIDGEYKPKKTEIEEWKECALKSKYLLDQMIKLGGMKYDNLEPILDMVQDINIPNTCSEVDKELAGVPSSLTNIT